MLEYAIRSLYVCVGFYTVTIPLRRAVLLIMMELCYGGLHNIIYIFIRLELLRNKSILAVIAAGTAFSKNTCQACEHDSASNAN